MASDSPSIAKSSPDTLDEPSKASPPPSLGLRFLNCIQCRREEDEEEEDADLRGSRPVSFSELFRYSTVAERWVMVGGCGCAVVEGALLPSLSFIGGRVASIYISTPNPEGDVEFLRSILFYALAMLCIGVAIFVLGILENWTLSWVAERMVARIRKAFLSSLLAQDAAFLDSTSAGTLSSQLNNNVDRISDGIGEKVGMLARSIATFLAAVIGSFIIDWKMTLIMLSTGPICVLNNGLMPRFANPLIKETQRITEEANGMAEEAILNTKTVAACNGQQTMIQRYSTLLSSSMRPSVRLGMVQGFFEGLFFFFLYFFFVVGLWYGIEGYHQGFVSEAGDVFGVINAIMYSSYILGILAPHIMAILKARAAAAVVYGVIDRKPSIDPRLEEGTDPSTGTASIHFSDVFFSYPTRPSPILRGLSWGVEEGETVALVGRSGCGKSTSIGLITRLYDVESGKIKVGGVHVSMLNVHKLRKVIGIVSQEPALFHGTIRENIDLGRGIEDEDIEKAARTANAHEFIMGLEKGYSTLLGPSGVSLSGGQKQRIAIARAIATNPRILLLDEATSALDTHSERVVQRALKQASEGRTTVVIAHRLSTIRDVHKVFVIDQGVVVEEGSYNELATKEGGAFAAMVNMQDVREEEKEEEETEEESSEEDDDEDLPLTGRGDCLQTSMRSELSEAPPEAVHPSVEGGVLALLSIDKTKVAAQIGAACFRGLELFFITIGQNFVFRALHEEEYKTLMIWTLVGEFLLGVVCWGAILLSRSVAAWVSESILHKLRVSCFSSLLHRPISYFDRSETSAASSSVALSQQPSLASPCVDYRISVFYENAFAAISLTGLCFFYCWPNGFVCIFCGLLFVVSFFVLQRKGERASRELEKLDTTGELAVEIFDSTRTIQLLAVGDNFISRFEAIHEGTLAVRKRRLFFRALVHGISQSFGFLTDFIATAFGVCMVYIGVVTPIQLYTSEVCVLCTGWAVICMSGTLNDLIASAPACRRLLALVDPDEKGIEEGDTPDVTGAVRSVAVSFAYPSRPRHLVAKSLSFSIRPGESLALVGPSGCGKSTIVNLLERFYDPLAGNLSVDSSPLPSLSLRHLRSHVALVSQEPVLFRGSIFSNVTLGWEGATLEDVRRVCRLANAAEFIEAFPMGYETEVGEKGRGLSGGQKQRIAIARALIRDPCIIVLDEATSALDTQSEQVVKAALEKSAEGRTTIMIAHRLDTIRHCTQICYLERGRIVERGNHESLMSLNDKYASLVREQKIV